MLILLPPSEGKSQPRQRSRFSPERLAYPELADARKRVAEALVSLSAKPKTAAKTLGLGPTQIEELAHNQNLWHSPTAPAIELFDGVLFESLNYSSLTAAQQKRATSSLLIFNALTGVAAPMDLLPNFRLSGEVSLPKLGKLSSFWASHLSEALQPLSGELVIDARSGTYSRFWNPSVECDFEFLTLKVVQKVGSGSAQKKVAVSHFNKATKGLLVRDLLTARKQVSNLWTLINRLDEKGWKFEYLPGIQKAVGTLEVFIRK